MVELYRRSFVLGELELIAKELMEKLPKNAKCLLKGEVGAGKTTLVKAILEFLGYSGTVDSPTFSLVNEYKSEETLIFHFDLYRLKTYEELLDIGWENYVDQQDAMLLVEWPERAPEAFDESWILIKLKKIENERGREISVFKF